MILAVVAWLAISPGTHLRHAAALVLSAITAGNVLVEQVQRGIPAGGWISPMCSRVSSARCWHRHRLRHPAFMPSANVKDRSLRCSSSIKPAVWWRGTCCSTSPPHEPPTAPCCSFRMASSARHSTKQSVETHVLALGEKCRRRDEAGRPAASSTIELIERACCKPAMLAREFDLVCEHGPALVRGTCGLPACRRLVFHLHDIIRTATSAR